MPRQIAAIEKMETGYVLNGRTFESFLEAHREMKRLAYEKMTATLRSSEPDLREATT